MRMAEDMTMNTTNTTLRPSAFARRRLCASLAAVSMLAALATAASLEAAQSRRPPSSRIAPPPVADVRAANVFAVLWQFGVPQPPEAYVPPEIVHEFWTLLGTYERYGIRAGFTFPQWIVRNGVTDPWEQHALIYLYSVYLIRTQSTNPHALTGPMWAPSSPLR